MNSGKLVLELELHARGEEGRTFEQPGDHRVGALADEAAEALGDARILGRELGAVLAQESELPIVEVEELPVHVVLEPVDGDLAAVELDIGHELDRHVDRIAEQVGAHREAHLELLRVDARGRARRRWWRATSRGSCTIRAARISAGMSPTAASSIERCAMSGRPKFRTERRT